MTGLDLDADASDSNNGMGVIPRAVANIFARAKQLKEERGSAWTFNIKGSFIEIYNEDLIDLLALDDVSGGRREVQIREDKDGHIIWGGLREVNVRNANEVMTYVPPNFHPRISCSPDYASITGSSERERLLGAPMRRK